MPTLTFEAIPYKIGDWTVLKLPKDASAQLPSRGQVMVQGTINGVAFKNALEPDGNWSHWLNITDAVQKSAGIKAGDTVRMEIESTKDWPEPVVPADWQAAIDADAEVKARWDDITPMARWEWLRWIRSTSNPATRQNRIQVSCSKLLHGERRPCCFNRNVCCVPEVSKNGVLLEPATVSS